MKQVVVARLVVEIILKKKKVIVSKLISSSINRVKLNLSGTNGRLQLPLLVQNIENERYVTLYEKEYYIGQISLLTL